MKNKIIFKIKNLNKKFKNSMILDNVNFDIFEGETLGIVGPSGCGKSTFGKILLLLLSPNSGEIIYKNKNIFDYNKNEILEFRKDVQMVLQDPYLSLNPRKNIKWHLEEPLAVLNYPKNERLKKILSMLELVGLSKDYLDKYPNQLSGGQKQRVLILAALLINPKIIVLDESVSALDISVQAQILNLLVELQQKLNLTYIFISHDLNVVKYMCDRIISFENGKVIDI
ncbi:MAG: ABC transporter ATP-binding protein [Cetobacterium sp.]|uniref:ABC transporter ATP-binding protein n=2 Tax=Fusobacteriaceae TaxID=203492 RepID=UPI001F054E86|nr:MULTISPECIES: dipeptide/oligopeptide/nickel ABC transporter ATP-binding protein [Cetobacterium]MCX3066680.1 dipeptide/oligopeptide/nickel ABC transporter ATP-binding protein [Cetobacterium somerae]UPO98682.1 dipeptide/oligopeptide/nickel ABC transporter ATP-binding protein [Cetobacterium somerae]